MSDVRSWLQDAAAGFIACLEGVGDDQWSAPTPNAEWDVRALVEHVADEQLWVPRLLAGRTIEDIGDEIPADPLGDFPQAAVQDATAGMLATLDEVLDELIEILEAAVARWRECEQERARTEPRLHQKVEEP